MTGPNNVRLLTETYSVTFAPEDSSRMTLAANPSMINPYSFIKSPSNIGYVTMATADTMSRSRASVLWLRPGCLGQLMPLLDLRRLHQNALNCIQARLVSARIPKVPTMGIRDFLEQQVRESYWTEVWKREVPGVS